MNKQLRVDFTFFFLTLIELESQNTWTHAEDTHIDPTHLILGWRHKQHIWIKLHLAISWNWNLSTRRTLNVRIIEEETTVADNSRCTLFCSRNNFWTGWDIELKSWVVEITAQSLQFPETSWLLRSDDFFYPDSPTIPRFHVALRFTEQGLLLVPTIFGTNAIMILDIAENMANFVICLQSKKKSKHALATFVQIT